MNKDEQELTNALYRAFCPNSSQLGEYQLGMLNPEQSDRIRIHLDDCLHCRRELIELEGYLNDLAPSLEAALVERIKVWVAKLLPPSGAQAGSLAPAFAVRGEADNLLTYQAGEALIHIEIRKDIHGSGLNSLFGLLTGIEGQSSQVELREAGQVKASTQVDELGNFVLGELPAGNYEISIRAGEFEILLPVSEL